MLTFLKCYDLSEIKKKVMLLYTLNVTDMLFTSILLKTGYFREINPLLIDTIEKPIPMFFIKIILPLVLLTYLYVRIKGATHFQVKVSNILLVIAIVFYGLINLLHISYFMLFLILLIQ